MRSLVRHAVATLSPQRCPQHHPSPLLGRSCRLLPFLLILCAAARAQEAPEIDPLALEWFQKGEALIDTPQQHSDQQAEYFEKAVELAPQLVPARYNLALIYIKQEKLDLALQHLNALIAVEKDDIRGYRLRAGVFEQRGQFDLLKKDVATILEIDPVNPEAWELLGRFHHREKRYQQALQAFRKVLELNPDLTEMHLQIAQVQELLDQGEEAVQSYQIFLGANPDDFQARFLLGRLYRRLHQNESALKEWLRAESLNPNDPWLAQDLGDLYLELGNLKEARERLLRGDGDNEGNLGIIARREGRNQEAEQHFLKALDKDPKQALLWAYLADALVAQDRKLEAIKAYQSALDLEPEDFSSLYNLASLHAGLGQPDQAIDYLGRALQVKPQSGPAHYNLALMLDTKKEYGDAQTHYLKALQNGIEKPEAHFRLAVLYARQSEPEKSLKHLEVAFSKKPQKFVPLVLTELRQVRSDLDSIRYRRDFNDLLKKYQPQGVDPVIDGGTVSSEQ